MFYKYTVGLFFLFLTACQISSVRDSSQQTLKSGSKVDVKYSVAQDRSELDKLRESIPEAVRKQNDEKALMAELTAELKHPPDVVRDKFFSILRKRRESFNKDMSRVRNEFNKQEKKNREEFLESLQKDRIEFSKIKVDREKRADFFNEQDQARRDFMAEQREKRDEFESDFKEKRKDFEDYLKEKTDEFNMELKSYTARWKDKIEEQKKAKENP